MKTTPQLYRPVTLAEATEDGCDLVQPKYRGLWCRVEIRDGAAYVLDPKGDTLTELDVANHDLAGTLVGDLFGPPKHAISEIVVWDCWKIGQPETGDEARPGRFLWTDIEKFSYRDRYAFARSLVTRIGLPLILTKNYPLSSAKDLWSTLPHDRVCGLVFRRSKDPVEVVVKVARRYQEVPKELI